ncbi:hypothetical protein MG293_003879 [Ovis ammon polii]|uniref:Uncharacterized protein n=1 Tax=Ovis ammon polii TaxID=230172 RepID=A0AAD4UNX8_OVIAM|nr:hypothetical protein MG293_003879 [Ovis ammon polii]
MYEPSENRDYGLNHPSIPVFNELTGMVRDRMNSQDVPGDGTGSSLCAHPSVSGVQLTNRERYEILFHQKSTALGSLKVNLILLKSDFHYKEKGSVIPPRHRRTRDSNQMTSSLISNTTILPGSCSPKSVKKILKAERC